MASDDVEEVLKPGWDKEWLRASLLVQTLLRVPEACLDNKGRQVGVLSLFLNSLRIKLVVRIVPGESARRREIQSGNF